MTRLSSSAVRLCRMAMLAALYVLLNMVAIKAGNLRITFVSLPVVVSAVLFGPGEAALTALLGEGLTQLLGGYGITATTLLWLAPPAIRGLLVGLAARHGRRTGAPLEHRPWVFYGVCVLAALATTAANTLAIWADSVLYGYYFPGYVLADLGIRIVTGTVTAVVVATVALPLTALLRRQAGAHLL